MGRPQPFHAEHFVPILKSQPEIYQTEIDRAFWKKVQPQLARLGANYVRVPVDNDNYILYTEQPLTSIDGRVQSQPCDDIAGSFEQALARMPEGSSNVTSARSWSVKAFQRA